MKIMKRQEDDGVQRESIKAMIEGIREVQAQSTETHKTICSSLHRIDDEMSKIALIFTTAEIIERGGEFGRWLGSAIKWAGGVAAGATAIFVAWRAIFADGWKGLWQ